MWHHNIQHNDTQHNNNQRKGLFLTLSITIPFQNTECHCARCHIIFIVMLNAIMLSVVAPLRHLPNYLKAHKESPSLTDDNAPLLEQWSQEVFKNFFKYQPIAKLVNKASVKYFQLRDNRIFLSSLIVYYTTFLCTLYISSIS
jgi:hypothetical protein